MAADPTRRHLLVVDDDDRIRDLLKEFLTRAGFRVSAAYWKPWPSTCWWWT
jgi:two-component system phosphate regulon response regulator OmpR